MLSNSIKCSRVQREPSILIKGGDVSPLPYLHRNLPDDGDVSIEIFQESLYCYRKGANKL